MIHVECINWPYDHVLALDLSLALFSACEKRTGFDWRFSLDDPSDPLIELARRKGPEQCVIFITPAGHWWMQSCITRGDNWKLAGPSACGQLYMGPDPFWMAHDCGVLLRRFFP